MARAWIIFPLFQNPFLRPSDAAPVSFRYSAPRRGRREQWLGGRAHTSDRVELRGRQDHGGNRGTRDRVILATMIPDGVGVRNFVLGKFLRSLPTGSQAHVFHGIPDEMLPRLTSGINGQATWHRLERFRPYGITDLLQGTLAYGQMYWANTVAMRRTLGLPIRGTFKRRVMQHSKRLLGRAAASPGRGKLSFTAPCFERSGQRYCFVLNNSLSMRSLR